MQAALLPYLTVYVGNTIRHEWQPGDVLLGADGEIPRLWLVTHGSLEVRLHPRRRSGLPATIPCLDQTVSAGTAILLPAETPRDIRTPQGCSWYSVGLTATLFGSIDLLRGADLPITLAPDDRVAPLLETLLARLAQTEGAAHPYSPEGVRQTRGAGYLPGRERAPEIADEAITLLLRKGLGEAIFALVWQLISAGDEDTVELPVSHIGVPPFAGLPPWLPSLLSDISRDPTLGIDDLAARAGLTEVQVRRAFRRHLNVTPSDYLRRARLDAARRLLETTDWTVATITDQVGFESASHFTRLFKSTFGYTPAQHRRLGA
jgi:AraC-like DNA-binding protein